MDDDEKPELTAEERAELESKIEEMTARIEADAEDAKAYNNRGVAFARLKQYETAISDYDKAIKIKPDYANAFYNRGIAYAVLEQYETAIADYDKAIDLNPKNAAAYNNRGTAYVDLEQYETAIANYDKAIEIEPDYAEAFSNKVIAYLSLGQYEKAITDFNKAIKIDPQNMSHIHNRTAALAFKISEQERVIMSARLEKEYKKKYDKELKKAEERFSKNLKNNAEYLREKIDQHGKSVFCFSFLQFVMLAVWFSGVGVYFWWVFKNFSGNLFSASNFLPYASLAIFGSTPIIWFIRVISQNILEAKSLKEDASRRLFLENNLVRLVAGNEEEQEVRQEMMLQYYQSWQHNSPVEILLQLNARRIGPETFFDRILPPASKIDDK